MSLKGHLPSEQEMSYADDLADVMNELNKVVRRIKLHAENQLRLEYAQAELEGRNVQVGYDKEEIRRLIMTAMTRTFGGVQGELAAADSEDH